jgi:phosphoglycerate dehydrogenase-like enzyme
MDVYAVDVRPRPAPPEVKERWEPDRLDDLIRVSDWFVVTAPLTPQTRGLIGQGRIGLLKPEAYIIVISRGGIVDLTALTEALQARRIAGAGLDAIGDEALIPGWRLPPDSPLWDMENVILTPHVSAFTPEMYARHREEFKENLRRFLANEPFPHVCDKRAGF